MSRQPRVRSHRQPAQVVVLFPILLLVVLGMGAIGIDTGRVLLARKEMQKASEAAALAGALAIAPLGAQSQSTQQAVAEDAVAKSLPANMRIADTVCEASTPPQVAVKSILLNTVPVNVVQVSLACQARWIAGSVLGGNLSIPQLQANSAAVVGSADPATHHFTQYDPAFPAYPLVLNNDDFR